MIVLTLETYLDGLPGNSIESGNHFHTNKPIDRELCHANRRLGKTNHFGRAFVLVVIFERAVQKHEKERPEELPRSHPA